jgi:hypothetical protein
MEQQVEAAALVETVAPVVAAALVETGAREATAATVLVEATA